jgi:MFS family permease
VDRNLRLLGVGVAIRTFGNALYFPFLALFLHHDLDVGYLEIGVIIVGVGLVQLPFNVLGGLLTDRIGRRRLILFGLASEAVATAGLAYAFALQSLVGAIAAATVGGIITTAAGPAFSAYIADFAEGPERTRGFTWFRIGFNAGFAVGVTIGGVLLSFIGFSGSVAVAAAVVAGGTALLFLQLDPSPFDRAVAGRSTPVPDPGSATPVVARRGIRESLSLLLRDRLALQVLVAVVLASLVLGQWAVTFPLYVHDFLGISYFVLGLGLALNGLIVVFGQSAMTESVLGRRHTTIAIAGIGLYVIAFLALGVAGLGPFFPIPIFILAVVVMTLGENLVTIPQTTLPSNMAPPGEIGSYNGAFGLAGGLGFLASVFVGGWVLSTGGNSLLIWTLLVLPAVPSIMLFRLAARRLAPEVDRA